MAGRHTHIIVYYVVPLKFTLYRQLSLLFGAKLPCYVEDTRTHDDLGFVS